MAGVAHEIITYQGAQHASPVWAANRYPDAADRQSWKRLTKFLADTLQNCNR
ncbi:MAG: dienelactone hydrolase family protein [Desulfobacterales bacterium]|nr:MAG: dienelactone hydrolase family protein [Desulfobacterales bacterium]